MKRYNLYSAFQNWSILQRLHPTLLQRLHSTLYAKQCLQVCSSLSCQIPRHVQFIRAKDISKYFVSHCTSTNGISSSFSNANSRTICKETRFKDFRKFKMSPMKYQALLFEPARQNYSAKASKIANVSAILKNQSALQVTKPARKKAPKITDQGKTAQVDNVVAYAMAEEINLEGLETHLIQQGLYRIGEMPQDVVNALHVRGKYNVDQKPKEIFVFRDGSVVFWCVPEIERGAFMKMLSRYSVAPYVTSLVIYEREELDFKFTTDKSGLVGDTIHLKHPVENMSKSIEEIGEEEYEQLKNEEKEKRHHQLLEMYTFSNALSQSVKLAIWEASLSKYVTSIVDVTEDLRNGNKIRMSRKQVLMKTGELFSLRHLINLSSDLLDLPDFYWDRATLEPLYLSLCSHLNITRRTRVMNEKLSHCCELTELISTNLNDAHHTRLEVMIIVLIMVEVVFECIHYAERYFKPEAASPLPSLSDGVNEPKTVTGSQD